ncbi:MAG: glycosyltransferase family 2 protein [Anaerolineales bacterium]
MTSLSVVIPAYNEERGIAAIMQRVLAIREDLTQVGIEELELLVVDDGSKDQTAQVATDLAHNEQGVRLIQHQHNRGYGAALKTGFSNAKGDLIGFLDADGTYPPEFFPQLCNAAINGSDLVIGSRMSGTESKMPLTRKVGNLFFASLLTLIGRQHVSDSASGMRVFKRQVLERIYPLPDGLNLTPVMSTRAIHEGIRMTEVPIPYEERMGNSKLSVVRDGSIFLQSIIWTVLMYNPVRILGMVGLGGVVVAMLVGLGLVIARLSGITELGPWGVAALFAALVSGVTGISIFALGSTFNYLVSLFYKIPIKQGLFDWPLLNNLDRSFGWLGMVGLLIGIALGLVSVVLGVNGWEIARLWLYLLGSALFILVGVQLIIYWVLISILGELSQREELTKRDLGETFTPSFEKIIPVGD